MGSSLLEQERVLESRQLVLAAMRAQAWQSGLWQEHGSCRWWQSSIAAVGANLVLDCGSDPHSHVLARLMGLMRWNSRPSGWLVWPDQTPSLQRELLRQKGYRCCEQLWLGSLPSDLGPIAPCSDQVGVLRHMDDRPAYVRYLQACHQLDPSHASLLMTAFVQSTNSGTERFKVFVVWLDGRIIAAITACVLPAPALGHLLWLGVLPAWRRRGLARMITLQACGWLLAMGVHRIHVQASPMAVGLYRSIGFQHHGDLDLWGSWCGVSQG